MDRTGFSRLPRLSWRRVFAVLVKEFTQLKRERLTFAMVLGIPVLQLVLFGYAINTDPKHLPTVVVAADASPYVRSIVRAVMLKGAGFADVAPHALPIAAFILVVGAIALKRYRQTLD